MNENCLAQPLETQASDSTGFRSFKQIIVELDQSITAYNKIVVEDPITRCLFVGSMVKWACLINSQLLGYLDKIDKGEFVEVLNVDFIKFSSQDYWLSGRIRKDMMAYKDIPLNLKVCDIEYNSSLEIYEAYEAIVSEMAVNFNKVKDTFEHLELYKPVIQQMKEQYSDPFIAYEYAQMKEMYIDPTLKDYLQMQVNACMDILHSGILNDVLSIRNEEVEAVDEAELYKMIDSDYETPPNLKKLWAKLKKFIEKKEDYLIVPKRDKLLKYVLKHKDILTVDHIRAVFKFDNVMMLIHQDMVKMKPELAMYLKGAKNEQTTSVQHYPDEDMFHFIHPSLDDEEGWKIHNEVKRLVKRQGVPDICQYLKKLASEEKILLPLMPSMAYTELVRMGMPNTGGFSKEHFRKQYHQ